MSTYVDKAPPPLFKPASLKPKLTPTIPPISSLPIDTKQCKKALTALLAHTAKIQEKREDEDLLGQTEEKMFVVVGLKRAAKREVHMPVRLPLAHPIINPRESPVTLFVKDPQRTYKNLLETSKITFVDRVVGLEKLRTKHKTFEAKRKLLKEGELFLVDDRVVLEVGKSLGRMWRDAKKQPVPVAISRKDLKAELERAIASTYLQINTGTSLSIKIGSTSLHTPDQLYENLLALLPQLAVRLPHSTGNFENIQSLHLKTTSSISLPIYNTTLDDEGVFNNGPTAEEIKAIQAKKAEKELLKQEKENKILEKEKRRIERSATKEGKGRLEKDSSSSSSLPSKKRKARSEDEAVVEEVDLPITEPSTEEKLKKVKKLKASEEQDKTSTGERKISKSKSSSGSEVKVPKKEKKVKKA